MMTPVGEFITFVAIFVLMWIIIVTRGDRR